MKRRPNCSKCNNKSLMVDYRLDLTDCHSFVEDKEEVRFNNRLTHHDKQCYFAKPEYYCWEHWGFSWPIIDYWPYYETVSTWQKLQRPNREGFRSDQQLEDMRSSGYIRNHQDSYSTNDVQPMW